MTNNASHFTFGKLPIIEAGENASAVDPKPVLKLIAGDASDRKFYRLQNASVGAICMRFPKWEGGYGGDPLSWLGMHKALLEMRLPVPQVLQVDPENACIWTEDFGDDFLNCRLGDRTLDRDNPECAETLGFYHQALSLLVAVQYPKYQTEHPALERAFDTEKLMFEMDFFLKHFVQGILKFKLEDSAEFSYNAIRKELVSLCTYLNNRERVLCHRDYHVRNVMIVDGKAKWIDFQDARMGPHTYDVVSLIRDSYVRMTPKTRDILSKYYFDLVNVTRETFGKKKIEWSDYSTELKHMGLQRNVKAIGSFGYLATLKGKPTYLRYVNHTLDTILDKDALLGDGADLRMKYPRFIAFLNEIKFGKLLAQFDAALTSFGISKSF